MRWLAGLVVVLGGLLNMGIFLRLGGEFLVHATGLNPAYLKAAMLGLLAIAIFYTVVGGMVAVVVTNYLQFLVLGVGMLTISTLVLWQTPWTRLTKEITLAYHAGVAYRQNEDGAEKSAQDRVAIAAKSDGPEAADALRDEPATTERRGFAARRQETGRAVRPCRHGRHRAASADDGKSGQPCGTTRGRPGLAPLAGPVHVYRGGDLADGGFPRAKRQGRRHQQTNLPTQHVPSHQFLSCCRRCGRSARTCSSARPAGCPRASAPATATPEYLARLLPTGIIGVVIAGMLAAEMSTDSSYILTWATVIYNDLIMPCFRRPLTEKAKLSIIRTLIVMIGVFLVFYGLVYELPGTAFDYLAVTGTICVASMFALLMGSVYMPWTNWVGASAAIVLGAAGPLSFVVVNAVVDAPHRIAPQTAGLSAYASGFWRPDLRLAAGQLFSAKTRRSPTNWLRREEGKTDVRRLAVVLDRRSCRHGPLVGDHVVSRRLHRPLGTAGDVSQFERVGRRRDCRGLETRRVIPSLGVGHFLEKREEPKMKKVKAGVIGCGKFALGQSLPNCVAAENIELHHCSSIDEQGRKNAEKFSPKKISADYRDLLGDPEVDMAMISRSARMAQVLSRRSRQGRQTRFLRKADDDDDGGGLRCH